MPAFTFEKISSPIRSTTARIAIKANSSEPTPIDAPRGLIARMMDRLVVTRIKRDESDAATPLPLE